MPKPPGRRSSGHRPSGHRPSRQGSSDHRRPTPTHERRDLVRVGGLPSVRALFAVAPERVERLFFLAELKQEVSAFCQTMAAARKPS